MRSLRPLRSAGWRRARTWLLPEASPAAPPADGELDALGAQHQEISLTLRNILHVLAGVCLFSVIALGSPDANLVASPTIAIPLLNYPVSFTAFLIVGPVLIGGLTLYLHVFYASLLQLVSRLKAAGGGAQRLPRVPKVAAVFNVDTRAGAALTWVLFYWAPPLVMALFAWRALPLARVGPTSFSLAAALMLVMIALQIRRCPPRWRPWVLPALAPIGLTTAALLAATVVTGRVVVHRGLDLVNVDLSNKDLWNLDLRDASLREAKLTGADLRRTEIAGADLQGADLTDSRFDVGRIKSARNWMLAIYDSARWRELGLTQEIVEGIRAKKLGSMDLTRPGLTGVDLRDADLSDFDLRGVVFGNAKLAGARLDNALLQGADLTSVEGLTVAQLEPARSWFLARLGASVRVNGYDFQKVMTRDLRGLDLTGQNLRNADLAGFDLRGAILAKADLSEAVFHFAPPDVEPRRANLEGANLEGAVVEPQALKQANNWMLALYDSSLLLGLELPVDHRALLNARNFSASHFSAAKNLFEGNFSDADLSRWDLSGGNFQGANLDNVKLAGAVLQRADLSRTQLTGVDLSGSDLTDANIARADLSGATLSCEQLWRAANWQESQRSTGLACPPMAGGPVVTPTPPVKVPAPPVTVPAPVPTPSPPAPPGPLVTASRRGKPHVNLVVLGATDSGKTTLLSAITKVLARSDPTVKPLDVESIKRPPQPAGRVFNVSASHVEFATVNRHYAVADAPDHRALMTSLVTGTIQADGGIVVVSATGGVTPDIPQQLRMARLLGLNHLVVFLDDVARLDDKRRAVGVEGQLRTLLASNGFGETTPIVAGSALGAANLEEAWLKPLNALLTALDTHIPTPPRDIDRPFLMPVEDVFSISGRGTVVTGRIERGRVGKDDLVDLLGFTSRTGVSVAGIEMFRKLLSEGVSGDNVGILVRSLTKDQIERGQVLAAPGTIETAAAFRAEAYLLGTNEGGRQGPIFTGYRPQIYVRTTDITGTVTLEGSTSAQPGGIATITVRLAREVALEPRTRFAIREGGRTVGAGFVTEVLPE